MKTKRKLILTLGALSIAPITIPIIQQGIQHKKQPTNSSNGAFNYVFSKVAEEIGKGVAVRSICQDNNGNMWVGNDNGLWKSTDGKTFNQVTSGIGSDFIVYTIFKDKDGNIWVGTEEDGLWKSSDGVSFTHVPVSLKSDWTISSVFQDTAGNIWITAFNNGLWESSDGKTFNQVTSGIGSGWKINNVFQDKDGNMWVGTVSNGLLKSSDGKKFNKVTSGIGQNSWIGSILQDSQGNMWIGTMGDGLWKSSDGEVFNKITSGIEKVGSIVKAYQDNQGNIWIGTMQNGLWISSNGVSFTQVTSGGIASNVPVDSIFQDKDWNIWAGLANGLWESSSVPFQIEFSPNSNKKVITNENKKYYLSNKSVILNVPAGTEQNGIIIDGKKFNYPHGIKKLLDQKEHIYNIHIIYSNITFSFAVEIKTELNISQSNFSTTSTYSLDQYVGYLNGIEIKKVNALCALGAGNPPLNIALSSDIFIDYNESFYQKINSKFEPEGNKTQLTKNISIVNNGLYLLDIKDYVGNENQYYAQLGGDKEVIPKTYNNTDQGINTPPGTEEKDNVSINGIHYDNVYNQNVTYYNNDPNIKKITIDGKDHTNSLEGFRILLKPGAHTIKSYTSSSSSTLEFDRSIFIKIDTGVANKDFSNPQGLKISFYDGYIDKKHNQSVSIIAVLDHGSKKANELKMSFANVGMDLTGKSYYQKINNPFVNNFMASPQIPIKSNTPNINGAGLYKLVLIDVVGNQKTYYLQIGGNKLVFPSKKSKLLSGWQIALISIASIIAFIGSIVLIIKLVSIYKKNRQQKPI